MNIQKYLICLISILCVSCSAIDYEKYDPDTGNLIEKYSMNTFLKRVEAVSVLRSPEVFGLQIGSTGNDTDIFTDLAKIIGEYK